MRHRQALAQEARIGQKRAMTRIPFSALALGLAGLLPFLYGVATLIWPELSSIGRIWANNFEGVYILQIYGITILCFMAGVIWGFAAKAEGQMMTIGLVLSVLPALFVFFFAFSNPQAGLMALILAFIGLLAVDFWCQSQGLAPAWWLRLRLLLTAIVVACLGFGVLYA